MRRSSCEGSRRLEPCRSGHWRLFRAHPLRVESVRQRLLLSKPDTNAFPVPEPSPTSFAPLAADRYRIQLTVSRETHDKFRRAQALLPHALPSGDPAEIFDRAVTLLVEQLERRRFAQTERPRATRRTPGPSRHIRQRCGAPCGDVTVAAAHSSGPKDAAVSARSWSSTTWSRMPWAEGDSRKHRAAMPRAQRVRGARVLRA